MRSPRTQEPVKNQFIIRTRDGVYFQSYQTVIAYEPNNGGNTVLDKHSYDYSRTTMKYLCQFLNVDSINDVRKGIENGAYELDSLN